MWPFKKTPKLSLEEWAATKPPAPCGNQKEHYFWTEIECWPCPICAKIKEQKQKEEDENRMAEKIAAAVVKKLQTNEVGR